ncbi:hypothetical protein ACWKSP_22130 [Micromonosporaceae bacterium Da 78-11]
MQLNVDETTYLDCHSPTGARVLNIRIDRHWDGIAVIVNSGRTTLDRQFPTLDEANAYLDFLDQAVTAGQPVWQIEAGAGALTSAAAVLADEAELIDSLNTDLDAADQARRVEADRLSTAVAEIVADADPNWRANLRKQVIADAAQRNTLATFVPTRTRVHLKPLTPAELDLIRNHQQGTVRCHPGQAWTVLRAIVRRGYGAPVYGTGRRIVAVELNGRGLNAAQQNGVAA